jgi:hypothetical protein
MERAAVDAVSPPEILDTSKSSVPAAGMKGEVPDVDGSSRFVSLAHVTGRARAQSMASPQASSLSNLRTAALQSQKRRNDKRGRIEWDWKAELFKNQPKIFRKEKFKVELEDQQQEVCMCPLAILEKMSQAYVVAWHGTFTPPSFFPSVA